jgi:hypothetical protein
MRIDSWMKATQTCEHDKIDLEKVVVEGPDAQCLSVAADRLALLPQQVQHIAQIIRRHFASRVTCWSCQGGPGWTTLTHFNDHPETTREDVDKVLRIYTEEVEANRAG